MRTVTVQPGQTINLGYQYDNESTQVVFPNSIISQFTDAFGTDGVFAIWYRRSGDALGYPIGSPLVVYAGGKVTWTITEADVANPGPAQVQLRYVVDEVQVMSQVFSAMVSDSVDIGSDVPEPLEAWADALAAAAVSGISDDIKAALLDCFAHVAWIDDQGQTYYDALEEALYPPVPVSSVTVTPATFQLSSIGATQQLTATILPSSAQATVSWSSSDTSVATVSESGLVTAVAVGTATITATAGGVTGTVACTVELPTLSSISAVYTQSGTVYDTDSLDSLKSDLVVTATYSDSSTATIPSTDYTLSGTLTVGTSTVTVSYGGKTTTFTVTVSGELPAEYQKVEWVGVENSTSTPTAYVETGVVLNNGDSIHAEIKPFGLNGAENAAFGTYDTAGGFEVYYSNTSTIQIYNANGNATMTYSIGSSWDTVDVSIVATTTYPLNLLVYRQNRYAFNGKIKTFIVSNGGTETHKFVPCYRKSDSVIGFYDTKTNTFHVNTGSGTLVKGNNV